MTGSGMYIGWMIMEERHMLKVLTHFTDTYIHFQTGVYSNTVVLQHHSVVMTKADKIYKVKCTYDMSSKNITFGMVPIRLVINFKF